MRRDIPLLNTLKLKRRHNGEVSTLLAASKWERHDEEAYSSPPRQN